MQMMKYALQGDTLINIEEVPSGLSCNCTCPSCGATLIARKGNKNEHHFAHYKAADCNHGNESALHLMAKNIIYNTKEVFVPGMKDKPWGISSPGRLIKFDKAELEKQLTQDIRSDVFLMLRGHALNVEIKVTHAVDFQKSIRLFNENISTIEIDLSGLVNSFDKQRVEWAIQKGTSTTFVYSSKARTIFAEELLYERKDFSRPCVGEPDHENCPWYRTLYKELIDAGWGDVIDDSPVDPSYPEYICDRCRDRCRDFPYSDLNCFVEYKVLPSPIVTYRGIFKSHNIELDKLERIENIEVLDGQIIYAELLVDGERLKFGTHHE